MHMQPADGAPQISVIMGVLYRRSDVSLLRRSIQSILRQTWTDFEFLICDDGSNRQTIRLIDELAERDRRIRRIRPGNKITLPEKLNVCLKEARGCWIARMDDDDFSHPDRFEKQLAALREHPEIDFVGCNVRLRREGNIVGQRMLPEFPEIKDFLFVQPFIHPALLFRREALIAVNGYSEDRYCQLCEDYDLLLRLYAKGYTGKNLQECLLDYSLPAAAQGGRTIRHRWNEAVTRYRRFRELKLLPKAFPYVVKPLAVGLLPKALLSQVKQRFYRIGTGMKTEEKPPLRE